MTSIFKIKPKIPMKAHFFPFMTQQFLWPSHAKNYTYLGHIEQKLFLLSDTLLTCSTVGFKVFMKSNLKILKRLLFHSKIQAVLRLHSFFKYHGFSWLKIRAMFLNSKVFWSNLNKIWSNWSIFHTKSKKVFQNYFSFLSIPTKISYQIDEICIIYVRYNFISKVIKIKWL